jgi:hypothetical protein
MHVGGVDILREMGIEKHVFVEELAKQLVSLNPSKYN